jgi:Ca2+-binding RTX toxin-like protein
VPAASSGATLEHKRGAGPSGQAFLSYKAGKGERNRLTVTATARNRVVFMDPGARIRRKRGDRGGCRVSRNRHRATCRVRPSIAFQIRLGDRADSIRFKGRNAGALGPRARTEVTDAAELAGDYRDPEGAQLEHALILGGAGNDTLRGTDQIDTLDGGPGADRIDGGESRDRIVDRPDGATDSLLGGRGLDTVDVVSADAVAIDLSQNTVVSGAETDSLGSVEMARGGAGHDTLVGTEGSDGLFGDGGDDKADGRGGPDYLGTDLLAPDRFEGGTPGVDVLTGGPGDDVLDGRDDDDVLTPTDELICGEGSDRIIGLQDDLADPSCESSAFGRLNDDLFQHDVQYSVLSVVNPVGRGFDGGPIYAITCPGTAGADPSCVGRVRLELAPGPQTGSQTDDTLGEGAFDIPAGSQADVTVFLNDAGRVTINLGERVSVLVLMGRESEPAGVGQNARFGWQQLLER